MPGGIHLYGAGANLLSNGQINVGGDVSGCGITVAGYTASGSVIDVDGDLDADLVVESYAAGDIDVGGALDTNGSIIVEGACDGEITIADETGEGSLIACYGGLEVDACIIINDGEGNGNDANGTIHVGQEIVGDPLDDVTFDGGIRIMDGSTSGGDLEGTIRVIGCHETPDDLDICIEGAENGTIDIVQDKCRYQVDHKDVCNCS